MDKDIKALPISYCHYNEQNEKVCANKPTEYVIAFGEIVGLYCYHHASQLVAEMENSTEWDIAEEIE